MKKTLFYYCTALLATTVYAWGSNNYRGYVGGISNQLADDVGNQPGNRYGFDLSFDYHSNTPNRLERKFTFNAAVNDRNNSMWSLNEAYLNHRWGRSELQFGRTVLDWSDVDRAWSFGKLNNRQGFNGFEPGQEGLVGIIFKRKHENGFRYRVFASGLYVPEMNPSLDINKSDGTITSTNVWSNPPAPTAEVSAGNEFPIFYNVDYPKIDEVIFRYSVGLNVGWENKHWEVAGFYMRKPENQLSQTVGVSVNLVDGIVNANVKPVFNHHDVYGTDIRWKNQDVSIYISGIAVRPGGDNAGDLEAYQYTEIETVRRREDYVGGGVVKENDRVAVGFNYVARLSPFNREDDILAIDPRWNQAVNAFFRYNFSRQYSLMSDVKYDMLTSDRLFMIRATYNPSRNMQALLGVNMIGSPADGNSFWSPYANNDAVYAGLRYLF